MASFWPSAQARQQMPEVAEGMNRHPKVVFSRTSERAFGNGNVVITYDRQR